MSTTEKKEEGEDQMAVLIENAARTSVVKHFGRFMEEVFEIDHPGVTDYTNRDIESHFLALMDKSLLPLKKMFMTLKEKNYLAWKAGDLILPLEEVLQMDVPYDLEWDSDVETDLQLYLSNVEDSDEETDINEVMGSDEEMSIDEIRRLHEMDEMDAKEENQSYKAHIE